MVDIYLLIYLLTHLLTEYRMNIDISQYLVNIVSSALWTSSGYIYIG